jgi:hypothetical protein
MTRKPFLNAILALSLLVSLVAMSTPPPTAARELTVSSAAVPDQTSPRQPQPLPPTMPVFHILPTMIDSATILGNAGLFNGIGASQTITLTTQGGLKQFFAFNPNNGDVVDQFDHTGGLFVVNASRAYTETEMTIDPSNTNICSFLANRQLFPSQEIEPQYTDCRNPPYIVKQIHLATLEPATNINTNSIIGKLVQIPLSINIGAAAPNYIPMGGPGGHLSLLLAGGPAGTPSLDDSLPGLQAFASPWFGRSRSVDPIGYYPVVPLPAAIERFKAQFPPGVLVDAGTPEMVYYLGFPDVPQDAVMPTWTFPDATAIISGTLVSLKNSTLPGVDGFAPDVNILSPTDGAVIGNGQAVSMTFRITGDQGPFNYTVSSDDSVVAHGVTVSGTLTLNLGVLPPFEGRPAGHILSVNAVNSYHISGDDAVFLGSVQVPSAYLPLVMKSGSSLATGFQLAPQPFASSPSAPDSTLRIGVEWVMDYHNPDSNLGQTKPDAEGLYNWLGIMGWQKTFNYGNDSAWEKDWRDCSLGGIDCWIGVDRAEFAYFSGHGSPSAWYFGIAKDYGGAWAGNARFQNIRWSAFSSCNTVRGGPYIGPGNPPLTDWFNSFQGSYMVLGFHSTMADVPFGFTFGFNMNNPVYSLFPWMQPSIAQAWVNTAFQMNAGKPSYLYAVGNLNPVNYKLPPSYAGPRPPLTGIYQFRWVWWDE